MKVSEMCPAGCGRILSEHTMRERRKCRGDAPIDFTATPVTPLSEPSPPEPEPEVATPAVAAAAVVKPPRQPQPPKVLRELRCKRCGIRLERSGKAGRPPSYCLDCKR